MFILSRGYRSRNVMLQDVTPSVLAAQAFFECRGIKLAVLRWRDLQFQLADPRLDGFGFEPVGMAAPTISSLVARGTEVLFAFEPHDFVQQHL